MAFIYGLALLAAIIIVWIAVRSQKRRRLKKYRRSFEQRPTVLRIRRDQNMRARDPDLQTRPPTQEDGPSSGRRVRK